MYSFLIVIQYISILVALAGIVYIYPKKPTRQKSLLNLILVSIVINEMGYLFEMQSVTMGAAVVAIKVAYVGKLIAELGIFIFVLRYADIEIPGWIKFTLTLLHAYIIGLVWTCENNTLYYKSIDYTTEGMFPHVVLSYGIVYNLFTIVTIAYMVIILIICIMRFIQKKEHTERVRMVCMSTPPVTFIIGLAIYRSGVMKGYDTTALSYLICALFFIFTLVKFDLVNEKEIVEGMLIEEFSEPVIVLNTDGNVIYTNGQFEQLYPDFRKNKEIQNNIVSSCESQDELGIDNKYYHVISKDLSTSEKQIGIMYVLRDVTQTHLRMQIQMEMKIQEENMERQKKQSDEMSLFLIKTLSQTIEAKDEYTRGHSARVSEYAELIAKKMGLSEEEVSKIKYASTLHDIGRIGVPDTILNKPSNLTDEEYEVIKSHCGIGADILQNIEIISYTADIAKHHHERYDGKGYPDGLKGDENLIGSRIVAVADAFDAMNSRRIYRNSLDKESIRTEIIKNRGLQFDPDVVDTFIELIDSGEVYKISSNEENDTYYSDDIRDEMKEDASRILSAVVSTMKTSSSGGSVDFLTGLMMRAQGEAKIVKLMKENPGALLFIDMDNLKPINDRYGHKSGDKALKLLGEAIGKYKDRGAACRVGGDEFLLYLDNENEETAIEVISAIADDFRSSLKDDASISSATVSAGICMSTPADYYSNVLARADKALYYIKQRGKAAYHVYRDEIDSVASNNKVDLMQVTKGIEEAGKYEGALGVEYRQFAQMYDYLHKVCERYNHSCNIVLVTLDSRINETTFIDNIEQSMKCMEIAIKSTIRTVDICTRYSSIQYLIVLLEAGDNVDTIMDRVLNSFYSLCEETELVPRYEVGTLFNKQDM